MNRSDQGQQFIFQSGVHCVHEDVVTEKCQIADIFAVQLTLSTFGDYSLLQKPNHCILMIKVKVKVK